MNLTKRILPIALIGSAIVVGTVVLFEERVSEYTPFQPSIERETFTTMEEQLVQEEATSNLKDGEQFSEDKNSDKEKSLHQKTISGQTNSNLPKENTSNKINEIGGAVTALDIITETNAQRAKFGLFPLSFNAKLTSAAQAKVDDMILHKYFGHKSPEGKGPEDLANNAGYEHIAIAENLALGNYESSAEIAEGWMNSPGHRKNIVSTSFTDIGVAVGQGMFEGGRVWFIAQEFGRPASDCVLPNKDLEKRIEETQKALKETKRILEEAFSEIEKTKQKYGPSYIEKIDSYNSLVNTYNLLNAEVKDLIEKYNYQVKSYNLCAR
jgi:uncharacterized protein YkwD